LKRDERVNRQNENKPGYKRAKLGWIPDDWNEIKLRDICTKPQSGFSPIGGGRSANEDEIGVLKLSCIKNGYFFPQENKVVEESVSLTLRRQVRRNTLLISRSNTDELVGAVCYVDKDSPNLFLSDLIWEVTSPPSKKVNLKWLSYLLCSSNYRNQIIAKANGTSGSMKKITKPSFMGMLIPLPPQKEQDVIAEILSTWDNAIEQTRKLIEGKKRCKKALMQQLLSGKMRLTGLNTAWKEYHLAELFKERVEARCDHLPLLAITGNRGVIPASEIERKDSSSEDKSKYKRIVPGDIGYNTMRMWQGVSAVSALEGIVSPA
jgi:type I restriction enzyme S subunit